MFFLKIKIDSGWMEIAMEILALGKATQETFVLELPLS